MSIAHALGDGACDEFDGRDDGIGGSERPATDGRVGAIPVVTAGISDDCRSRRLIGWPGKTGDDERF